ncbi:MAG: sugar ABC transporter ATP-binding protein [Gemmatimonadales bacterium]
MPRLVMRGIARRFGATAALAGVDLAVAPGEVHALLGQNGAGKSTLMKVLAGAVEPDAGTIELDGEPYRPANPADGRRRGIGMIYQELSLAPHLSVTDNIFLGAERSRRGVLDRKGMRVAAVAALAALGHGDLDPDRVVGQLSPAAQQVVEIARALAIGCRVLVLDEPTSSLGRQDAERLFATVRRLAEQGHAVILITHFIEEALAIADRYSVLRDGRVVAAGAMTDATAASIVRAMMGGAEVEVYPRSLRVRGEAVLDLAELAGVARPATATLTLHRGEVLGIFGLVGSGRTELVRAVMGLDPVRRGTVRVLGRSGPASPAERWAAGVGMVSEDRKGEGLATGMSIADNLTLTKLDRWLSDRSQAAEARPWIDRLDIRAADPLAPVSELSGGNQQKVALGRLLRHDVDVLLLDEPTRGIDVGSKAAIYRLIDDLVARADRSRAVLLIGSYLPELLGVADRIAVMSRGVLGPFRPVASVSEHELLLEAAGVAV